MRRLFALATAAAAKQPPLWPLPQNYSCGARPLTLIPSNEFFRVEAGNDVLAAAGLIADARADVLLYLALGHSHITYNLARSRLAKIQIVFGRVGQG